jgi:hypothetical protein
MRNCQLCCYSRFSQHFMEPEDSLLCSQPDITDSEVFLFLGIYYALRTSDCGQCIAAFQDECNFQTLHARNTTTLERIFKFCEMSGCTPPLTEDRTCDHRYNRNTSNSNSVNRRVGRPLYRLHMDNFFSSHNLFNDLTRESQLLLEKPSKK